MAAVFGLVQLHLNLSRTQYKKHSLRIPARGPLEFRNKLKKLKKGKCGRLKAEPGQQCRPLLLIQLLIIVCEALYICPVK